MRFLADHAPAVCKEVRGAYVDTMSRLLQAVFKAYNTALAKLKLTTATKNDLIVVEQNAVKVRAAPTAEARPCGGTWSCVMGRHGFVVLTCACGSTMRRACFHQESISASGPMRL